MENDQLISWLPRVYRHELLEPSVTWREKSIASYKSFKESRVNAHVVIAKVYNILLVIGNGVDDMLVLRPVHTSTSVAIQPVHLW